jgi:FAD/FMN-containing dehydrogenase
VAFGDPDEGMVALQPLRELAEPLADLSDPTPYTTLQSEFDPFFERGTLQCYWKSLYLSAMTDDVIDVLVARAHARPAPLTLLNVLHLGGALNRVGATETAFAERTAQYMVSVDGIWTDPADNAANIGWVRETWRELGRYGTGSTYLNFSGQLDERPDAGVDDAFGQNLRRLAELKSTYDPNNVFRANNNIVPAPRSGRGR